MLNPLSQPVVARFVASLFAFPVAVFGATSDLSVGCSSDPGRVVANQLITFRIAVTNHGPHTAPNVTVTNQLPAGSTLFSVAVSQGSIATNSGVLRLMAGDLAAGSSLNAEVKLFRPASGFLTNIARCASTTTDPVPANNVAATVVQVCSPTFISAGQMLVPRSAHTATLLGNGRVLITGGYNAAQRLASAELFDPGTGTTTSVGNMLMPRYGHTATLLPNGKVLIAGHSYEDGMRLWTELYDPVSNTLSRTGDMTVPRTLHAASLLPDGRVLATGGIPANASAAETYDYLTGTWTLLPSMAATLIAHTSTVLPNGEVLLAGGWAIPPPPATMFGPSSNAFYRVGSAIQCRENHTATLLPDGRVLIAGGGYGSGFPAVHASAEFFSPATSQFTAGGTMIDARATHTASLLTNGTVLLAGGTLNQDAVTTEIFDPASGLFHPAAPLQQPRLRHTATSLSDGRILILGGEAGSQHYGQFQSSAEIYDPNLVLAPPAVSISDVAASEDALDALAFPVSLSAPMAVPVSFHYSLSIGSAWWDEDFRRTNGVLTFAPGTTNLTLKVPVIPDNTFETDELIVVTISNAANAVIARNRAVGTIVNDDPVPTVHILPGAVTESNLLRAQLRLPAVLSNPSYQTINVSYETAGQTAVAGTDFEPATGLLTFSPGVTTQFVTVQVIGDIEVELEETFTLILANPTNAAIGAVASGTILNDDGLPAKIHHFDLGAVGPVQHHSVAFPLTLTARDLGGNVVDFDGPILLRAPSTSLSNWWFTMETDLVSDWRKTNFTYLYGFTEMKPFDVPGHGTLSMALRIVPSYGKNGGVARDVALAGGAKYFVRADLVQANENAFFDDNRFDYTLKLGGAVVTRMLLDQLGRLAPGQIDRRVLTGEFTAPTNGVYTLELLADTSFPASHSAIYVDNIRIEAPGVAPALLVLTNGLWSGNVSLAGVVTNLSLQAIDFEGHNSTSNPFRLDPNANVSVVVSAEGSVARTFALCPWTLRVNNEGPSPASNVTITNTLPEGFSFVSANSAAMTCTNIGNLVVCTIPMLSPGAWAGVDLTVRAGSAGWVTNLAAASAAEFDSHPANNSASLPVLVFPPLLTASGTTVTEAPGPTNAVLSLVLSSSNDVPVSVSVQTVEGTATSGLDYSPIGLPVIFPPGVRTQLVSIPIVDDLLDETNETFSLLLNDWTNAVVEGSTSATVTIVDDDLPTLVYARATNGLRFEWSGSYVLQSNNVPTGTGWVTITSAPPITVPIRSSGSAFFRLTQPK